MYYKWKDIPSGPSSCIQLHSFDVTFSGQTKPSKAFSSSKILRCYHFYGFPHSLIHFISCFYWQLSRTTEPKYHRPGCAVPKRLVPHQVRLPFSLRIGSLPLPVFHVGGLFWARSVREDPGSTKPRAASMAHPLLCLAVQPCKQCWSLTWQEGRSIFPQMTLWGLLSTYSVPDTVWRLLHSSLVINWAIYCFSPFPDRKQDQKL